MFLIWGDKLFGRVGRSPGVGYVASWFMHFYFLPILPYHSYVIAEGTPAQLAELERRGLVRWVKYGFYGVRVRPQFLSVFMAYLRVFLGLLFLLCLTASVAIGVNPGPVKPFTAKHLLAIGMAAAFALAYWATHRLTRSSAATFEELAARHGAGVSAEAIIDGELAP